MPSSPSLGRFSTALDVANAALYLASDEASFISGQTLVVALYYAVFAAGGLGELSQVWGEISQASGAAERLMELMAVEPAMQRSPAQPNAAVESASTVFATSASGITMM